MTYQHALHYLFEQPLPGTAYLPADLLASRVMADRDLPTQYLINLPHDRQGRATARYLRAMLSEAGISCLHLTYLPQDGEAWRDCLYDGTRLLSPTVLCDAAEQVRKQEILLRRHRKEQPYVGFSPDRRTPALLLLCAAAIEAQVVLLEGEGSALSPATYAELLRAGASAVRPVSLVVAAPHAQGALAAVALLQGTSPTREIISLPGGAAHYSTLSAACATHTCRLTTIATSHMSRHDVRVGSQAFSYRDTGVCRLTPGTTAAAEAAALAAECALALGRAGLNMDSGAICRGLTNTVLPDMAHLAHTNPYVIVDEIETRSELVQLMQDLHLWEGVLPHPHRLCVDPALGELPATTLRQEDHLCRALATDDTPAATTVLAGSPAHVRAQLDILGLSLPKN